MDAEAGSPFRRSQFTGEWNILAKKSKKGPKNLSDSD